MPCVYRPQQRFLISPSLESGGLGQELTAQYGWIRLEERKDVDRLHSSKTSDDASSPLSLPHIYMPGSGIAKRLYLHWYHNHYGFPLSAESNNPLMQTFPVIFGIFLQSQLSNIHTYL